MCSFLEAVFHGVIVNIIGGNGCAHIAGGIEDNFQFLYKPVESGSFGLRHFKHLFDVGIILLGFVFEVRSYSNI